MKKYRINPSSKINILQEPAVSYIPGSLYQLSANYISKKYIKHILQLTQISVTDLISLIPISIDTYKRKKVFNPDVTEKILEIEEVYHKGIDTFGDSFHKWMDTENIALGRVAPKSLLNNSFGVRLLLDEIGRIEYGILA